MVLLVLLVLGLAACGGSSADLGTTDVASLDAVSTGDISEQRDITLEDAVRDAKESAPLDVDDRPDAADVPPPDALADTADDVPADTAGPRDVSHAAPYTLTPFDEIRIESTEGEYVRDARASIDLVHPPFARVVLIADLTTTCFPFEQWYRNPPPAGHNWPADCDAFDRNFEFTLDDPAEEGDLPAIELVRAITPFGGPLTFEVDITDLANGLPGPHRLRAHISTWSDPAGRVTGAAGGWTLSARIEVEPGPAPRQVLAVVPLFDHSIGAGAGQQLASFSVPRGTTATRLEYRVTGHGGGPAGASCIGPAEEFCSRTHVLSADGAEYSRETPWRDDCDELCTLAHFGPADAGFDYCAENPTGAVQSVRAPRANWCPGSVTPPYTWDVEAFRGRGTHSFGYEIPSVAEGGSWRVSAVFFAFGAPGAGEGRAR